MFFSRGGANSLSSSLHPPHPLSFCVCVCLCVVRRCCSWGKSSDTVGVLGKFVRRWLFSLHSVDYHCEISNRQDPTDSRGSQTEREPLIVSGSTIRKQLEQSRRWWWHGQRVAGRSDKTLLNSFTAQVIPVKMPVNVGYERENEC